MLRRQKLPDDLNELCALCRAGKLFALQQGIRQGKRYSLPKGHFTNSQREYLRVYLNLRNGVPSALRQAAMALRYHAREGSLKWVSLYSGQMLIRDSVFQTGTTLKSQKISALLSIEMLASRRARWQPKDASAMRHLRKALARASVTTRFSVSKESLIPHHLGCRSEAAFVAEYDYKRSSPDKDSTQTEKYLTDYSATR